METSEISFEVVKLAGGGYSIKYGKIEILTTAVKARKLARLILFGSNSGSRRKLASPMT